MVFEVTKVTDSEIEIFDTRWRRKDNGKVAFRPYLDGSGAPSDMEVGKSWPIKYEVLRKGSSLTKEFTRVGKVEAWARITLPSGTAYDAFKIDLKVSPSSVVSGHKLEAHATMWFAPAVNRLVKRIDESRDNGKLRDASEQTL